MAFINNNYGEIKVDKQMNVDVHKASEAPSESGETTASPVHLSKDRGTKIDFIRVVNCLYELGFFTDDKGGKISKKEVMTALGKAVNIDLSEYQNDLSRSLSDSTKLEKHLSIFDRLKEKMVEVFNNYGG